jgi:hypothetical protein
MFSKHLLKTVSPATLALLLLGSSLQGCAGTPHAPYVVALPNGYYLQRDRDSRIELVRRDGRKIVRGPIAAYAVDREIVGGCVGEWPKQAFSYPNETPYPDSDECRYFILSTPSGELESGMDPKTWRARLAALGAQESLRIKAPILPE